MTKLNKYIVFLLTLIFVQFFKIKLYPIFVDHTKLCAIGVFLLCAFYFMFNARKNNKLLFQNHLFVYLFFAIVNMITCYIFRGQSMIISFWAWNNLLLIFLYFGFSNFRLSIKDLEKIIQWLFFVILISYIIQNLVYPTLLFNLNIVEEQLEKDLRVRIFSDGILSLGGIYYLNKFFEEKKKRYVIYCCLFVIIVFLQGFRMILFATLVSTLVMYYSYYCLKIRKIIYYGMLSCVLIGVFMQTDMYQNRIAKTLERTENENLYNQDYVRVASIYYFYNSHFQSDTEMILGSGCSLWNDKPVSTYSDYMRGLKDSYHFFPVDWGLIGLSWEAGILFTLCFILLIVRVIFLKVDKQYYYVRIWSFFLLIIGVTHPMSYCHSNLIYMAIVLLIAERAHLKYVQNEQMVDARHLNDK